MHKTQPGLSIVAYNLSGYTIKYLLLLLLYFFLQQNRVFSQDSIPEQDRGYLVISGGVYSCLDLWASAGFVNAQIQPGWKLWIFRPQAGVLMSFTGAFMVYGGLIWPASPVKWLVIQTGAAMGYYESGDGVNLGYPLEFRLSLSILYKFRNSAQLGMEFAHISNANLGPPNPGTESISFIFQFPVRSRKVQLGKSCIDE